MQLYTKGSRFFSLFQGFDRFSNLHTIANGVYLKTAKRTLLLYTNY
jgi:hypothetical protein